MSNYARAGIHDVSAFYRNRFVDPGHYVQEFLKENPLNRLSIGTGKLMWISHNIRRGSRVLDFGCGSGALGFLKHKGCEIFGVELSEDAKEIAAAAGYCEVFVGLLEDCDFPRGSFDHVVSLDVFGHIEFADKDAVIAELQSFLKPGGTMVHGIEAGQVNYDAMTDTELRDFVGVDGHVGVEPASVIKRRFSRFFPHVQGRTGFDHHQSRYDKLKHWENYGHELDIDLALYLQTMNAQETFAFDLATGIVNPAFQEPDPHADYDDGGFMLLVASAKPIHWCAYENEAKVLAQEWPFKTRRQVPVEELIPLDDPTFMRGWYPPEKFDQDICRWGPATTWLILSLDPQVTRLQLSLRLAVAHGPVEVVCTKGASLEIVSRLQLKAGSWQDCVIDMSAYAGQDPLLLRLWCGSQMIPAFELDCLDVRELALGIRSLKAL